MSDDTVAVVRTERGGVVEAIHRAAAAVVDVEGRLVARIGDPDGVYYVRSSGKPLQAVAAAEAGAFERFQYTSPQIALATASHSGEVAHITEVKAILAKLGVGEDCLICGLSYPLYERRRDEMIRAGEPPSRLHHNCSGKHCAMIAAALARNEDPTTYWRQDHPHQRRIVRLIAEMAGLAAKRIRLGVDGCGVPAHALPLRNMALAFARLIDPSALGRKRAAACQAVRDAMCRYPYLVAGSQRFDTALLKAGGGMIVCKGGAQGYFAAGVRPSDPAMAALGIALKIEDGDHVAACQAALEILDQLGLISEEQRWQLSAWHEIPIKSPTGETVGASRPILELVFEK